MTREEALQNIKKAIGFSDTLDESIFTLFPELKENEDERTRKELIELISCMHDADPRKKRWIAYLERQKEQKPADEAEQFFDSAESYHQGFIAGQKKMKEEDYEIH